LDSILEKQVSFQDQLGERERKLLTQPTRRGSAIPPTLEVLILGLFRSDIWIHGAPPQGDIDLIGWYWDPFRLWSSQCTIVLRALAQDYKDQRADPKAFIRAQAPYKNDLFTLGLGQVPPQPEIIYTVAKGERFKKVESANSATHVFVPGTAEGLRPLETRRPTPPNCVFYRSE